MDDKENANRADGMVEYYANTARIEASVYDFGIVFGRLSNDQRSEDLVVRMSPQHAKSVVMLLQRFLDVYEREVGAVVLPQKLVKQLQGEEVGDAGDPQN
jgi:hypothetical protein